MRPTNGQLSGPGIGGPPGVASGGHNAHCEFSEGARRAAAPPISAGDWSLAARRSWSPRRARCALIRHLWLQYLRSALGRSNGELQIGSSHAEHRCCRGGGDQPRRIRQARVRHDGEQ